MAGSRKASVAAEPPPARAGHETNAVRYRSSAARRASTNAPSSELSANRFFGNGGIGANARRVIALSLESVVSETVGGLSDALALARAASNEPRSDRLAEEVSLASFSQRRCNASKFRNRRGTTHSVSVSLSPLSPLVRVLARTRTAYTAYAEAPFPAMCASATRAATTTREDESSDPKDVFGFSSSSKRVSSSGTFVGNKRVGSVPSRGASPSGASPPAAATSSSTASIAARPLCAHAGEQNPSSGRSRQPTRSSRASGRRSGSGARGGDESSVSRSSASATATHLAESTRCACFSNAASNGDGSADAIAPSRDATPRASSNVEVEVEVDRERISSRLASPKSSRGHSVGAISASASRGVRRT